MPSTSLVAGQDKSRPSCGPLDVSVPLLVILIEATACDFAPATTDCGSVSLRRTTRTAGEMNGRRHLQRPACCWNPDTTDDGSTTRASSV